MRAHTQFDARAHKYEVPVETNARGTSLEDRLGTLTEFGTDILKRWATTAERHAAAVSEFEAHLHELSAVGTQLHEDASNRLRDLERIIQQEWDSLRHLHEAPIKNLVEQAASLTQVCVATANSAQSGFDRAEARLAALETEFHRTTSELTREIHALVSELRNGPQGGALQLPGHAPSTPSWPLEGVTRLHSQLREAGGVDVAPVLALPDAPALAEAPASPVGEEPPLRRYRAAAVVMLAAVVIGLVGVLAWRIERDVRASAAQMAESQRQLRVAADAAARAATAKERAAARELAAAQQLAARVQLVGDVLAAPDLIRYALVGRNSAPAATGQLLWSRSRGFVFSASGLPAPPQDSTYQVWLLTRAGAISAGTFVPDAGGSATVTNTPSAPPPVIGAMVTLEPKGGGRQPSGEPLLARRLPVSPGT